MRLVIDLQAAQSGRSGRAIGRYGRSLALAMAAEAGPHEVVVALNGGFPEATVELRDAFAAVLPPGQVRVWHGPGAQSAGLAADAPRRRAAERIRAAFLSARRPDALLVASMFDGFGDDAVTTFPPDVHGPPVVCVCDDPIPPLAPDSYLENPEVQRFHARAVLELQQSAGLLATSAHSQAQLVAGLGMPADRVAAILGGVGPLCRDGAGAREPQSAVLARHGLQDGYVLSIGAAEHEAEQGRLRDLIAAYALLPGSLRRMHPLVVAGWHDPDHVMRRAAAEAGLEEDAFKLLPGSVRESDLPALYRGSAVTACLSSQGGFGRSVAEAMACGAAAICSNEGGPKEVIGRDDATFDPAQPPSIAERMRAVLERPAFREELRRHGQVRSELFTWPRTARRAWDALERLVPGPAPARSGAKPHLGVVASLGDDEPALLRLLLRLSRSYAVSLMSDDPASDPALGMTFPVQRPAGLMQRAPDRLLFLPGDDPHHWALTLRLSFAFAGIVVAGPRPIAAILAEGVGTESADVLHECLLDSFGWQAAVAARGGASALSGRYALEPGLRARSAALIEMPLDQITADMIEQCYADTPRAAAEACAAALAAEGLGLPEVARAMAVTFAETRMRALFLDVTTLAVFDAGTGIQRVVREITHQLGLAQDLEARVEPVRSNGGTVTLARAFGRSLYGVPDAPGAARAAVFAPGDVFVCLDLNVHDRDALASSMRRARAGGGRAVVVIYDLLPVLTPQRFPEPVRRDFPLWLHLIASQADGLLCISRTVADELLEWLARNPPARTRPLDIGWFHLGSDFNAAATHAPAPGRLELLMVGTVEPRKGHSEALDAMEEVWRTGADVGLVIVGRAGWHTEALQARLRNHSEAGRRLRWLTSATDEQVSALYRRSAALLMASEGEGFGLPIVEAAHAGLPVIARDIPVFREICGEGALLFGPGGLAATILRWLALHEAGRVPDPAGIVALRWSEASRRMAQIVLEDDWYARWTPPR